MVGRSCAICTGNDAKENCCKAVQLKLTAKLSHYLRKRIPKIYSVALICNIGDYDTLVTIAQ